EALPLTPSGKVNRLGLPAPDQGRPDLDEEYVAPANPIEERLAEIWQEVLKLKQIGIQDDFFELGGHSLVIAQVISRVRESLKLELPPSSLFEARTIAALAKHIRAGRWKQNESVGPPLTPLPREGGTPLSFAQQVLWFIDVLEPGSCAYHVPVAVRLEGLLSVDALERSLGEIVRRHEILRTTISFQEGEPVQVISDDSHVTLRRVDLGGSAKSKGEEEARRIVNEEAKQAFDLARGPLMRCLLVRFGERQHILAITLHHIIADGWSLGILLKELSLIYTALAAGRPIPILPALPVQYADYARWQKGWMQGAVLEKHVAYWKASLVGAPPNLKLPFDHAAPMDPSKGSQETMVLPKPLFESMLNHCRREGVTPFMLLMATLAVVLERWTGQSDMVIGTVVAGRNRREVENSIGCFMNFMPIRARLTENQTGRGFLLSVLQTVLEAQAHQECPFEKIVEAINPERRLDQNPLYNVALLLQSFPGGMLNSEGLTMSLLPVDLQAVLLDLRFIVEETDQGMAVACEYRAGWFEVSSIRHLLDTFATTLETLIQQPETRLCQFDPPQRLAATTTIDNVQQDEQTLAIAATFVAEPLGDSLKFWTKELELPSRLEFAPYNQIFQQLLDPGSLLATNVRGINVVLLRWEDWERCEGSTEADGLEHGKERLERNAEEFIKAIKMASSRTAVPWLVCFCPTAGVTADNPRVVIHQQVETRLSAELERLNGVYLVTAKELNELYPVADYHDPRTEELGRIPYTPLFFTALGTMIVRKFHAQKRPAFKVIVLDCDQTLWAGVCGEDGPKGIRLDPARLALQEFMRAQYEAGMLLCVSSKNNEEDVTAVFNQRPEMPLRREHFAGWRVNWRPKSENLKSLAQELRLGLDSFIFIDDNPVECAEVDANCGEVLTLQLPEAPELIPQFLKHCWAFDHLRLSKEDRQRTALYKEDQRREHFRSESSTLGNFLAGLDLKVVIEALSESQLSRTSQLTQRTNQFNFTTRRRTESELQAIRQNGNPEVFTVSVSDRFGDYGLVGTMILRPATNALVVDSFLLSCRVLGRGVEHQMLARLGKIALRHGLEVVDVHFVPTTNSAGSR
ncbi:MAG: FkbH like protein, partial [Pedosphaera sp.]|nr:FkbH like protein [Pedosphaera sp.]